MRANMVFHTDILEGMCVVHCTTK